MINQYRILRGFSRTAVYAAILAGAVVFIIPFLWMISTSLKQELKVFVFPPQFIPDPIMWENYRTAMVSQPFGRYTLNTVYVTLIGLVGNVGSCAIVAYGFSRLRFPGRDTLFLVMLSSLMIPFYAVMIPRFILFRYLGWIDTFLPLIVPYFFAASPIYIFLLRQYFSTIPKEMDESARIDGCDTWGIFLRIILPMSKPALGVIAILVFVNRWNWFLEPLIYIHRQENYVLSLGLSFFRGEHGALWHLLMAASTVTMLPCILLFFFFQRAFIQGIVITGVKG
jgi:multiple sugar transport system permease protein